MSSDIPAGVDVRGFAGLKLLVSQIPDLSPTAAPQPSASQTPKPEPHPAVEPTIKREVPPKAAPNPTRSNKPVIVVGGAVALLLILWIVRGTETTNRSPERPPHVPPSDSRPQRPNLPSDSRPRVPPPVDYSEVAPTPGDRTRIFNQSNIRWCLYQRRRIEIIRSKISNELDEDISTFNALVNDWNSRCGAYRYDLDDMTIVRAELPLKETNFESEAIAITNGWPHRRVVARPHFPGPPSLPRQQEEAKQKSPPPPPPIDERPASVSPPVLNPMDEAATTNEVIFELLRIENARAVQRRLADLGYLAGVSPTGIWTSRSRQALREFKAATGLPGDDIWDQTTKDRLFASDTKTPPKRTGSKLSPVPAVTDTRYPPLPGTSYNPLNRAEAINLQKRLGELGFLASRPDGVWGLASRAALREFKAINSLPPDDQWDAETERALMADQPVRASYTFVGGWAEEIADCRSSSTGGAPLRITVDKAEMGGVICKFGPASRDGITWRLQATCTGNGRTWTSDVSLTVSGEHLTWSSGGDANAFVRCRGN